MSSQTRPPSAVNDKKACYSKQAVELESEMLIRIERFLPILHRSGDWRLGAGLGALVLAYGNMRFLHVQRARFLSKTSVAVKVEVYRDKTPEGGVRSSKIVAVPAESLVLGGDPMQWLWELWHQCCSAAGKLVYGLIRDYSSGNALSIKQFQDAVQSICVDAGAVSELDAAKISTYGFRRVQATAADIWGASWSLSVALGWRSRGRASSDGAVGDGPNVGDSLMPITYAGRLTDSEIFAKTMMLRIVRAAFRGCEEREVQVIRWEAVRTFSQDKTKLKVWAKALAEEMEDKTTSFAAYAEDAEAFAKLRHFEIPEQRPAFVFLEAPPTSPVESEGAPDTESGTDSVSSLSSEVVDGQVHLSWVTPNRGGKIHLASQLATADAKCDESRQRQFKEAQRGEVLSDALVHNKMFCDKCFNNLADDVRDKVNALWVSRVQHSDNFTDSE